MPAWVSAGYDEYAKRLSVDCSLHLTEIPLKSRNRTSDLQRSRRHESLAMLAAIPAQSRVIALEVHGHSWSTEQLAAQMRDWMHGGRDVALLVGGPEGLDTDCLARAEQRWSLSALTLPHPLVRIVVAEQLYRAWSILHNHPYHRA